MSNVFFSPSLNRHYMGEIIILTAPIKCILLPPNTVQYIRQVIFLLLENKTEETINVCTVTLRVSFLRHPMTVSRIKNSRSTSSHHVCLRHFVSLQICRFRQGQAEEASHNDDVTQHAICDSSNSLAGSNTILQHCGRDI